jgi:hypothetical protein
VTINVCFIASSIKDIASRTHRLNRDRRRVLIEQDAIIPTRNRFPARPTNGARGAWRDPAARACALPSPIQKFVAARA